MTWLVVFLLVLVLLAALWLGYRTLRLLHHFFTLLNERGKAQPRSRGLSGLAARPLPAKLATRLELSEQELRATKVSYQRFCIPKRSGGERQILAPNPALKKLQRRILSHILNHLPVHPAVTGFEPGQSIASNAARHCGKALVVRMDIQDFFPNTSARRVKAYFLAMGWDAHSAAWLTRWCCRDQSLPQGAPTSPRLSNLINYRLDARLNGLARKFKAQYSRYADDLTFSFAEDDAELYGPVIRMTERILRSEGYTLHKRRKLHLRRAYEQQQVTGLVVNHHPQLPRTTRRWLRAVRHRLAHDVPADLSPAQLAGWDALQHMIRSQGQN
jgi:RNA-directed DNA polymerase